MKLRVNYKTLKNIFFLLLFAWHISPALGADSEEMLFVRGNELFAKARYKDAVDVYQKIVSTGYQSAPLYFNLGNAYFRTGDISSALLYYEKAHKLDPGDEDINFNIQVANLRTTDKIEAAPDFFIFRWWRSFILLFSLNTLAVLTIIFFLLGSAGLIFYLFSPTVRMKKTTFFAGSFLLLAGIAALFTANRQAHYFRIHHEAIIFCGSVTARSEPDASSKAVFVIHSGAKVGLQESANDWMKIKLPNGNTGWIKASDAKEI